MKQYTENLYDDDLTVETDDYDYDDSYSRDGVDLFEFSTDEESPISHLKSLILSIDWEITDEVLLAFSEELEVLRALWAGEKINLIYIQALEKISKYIYHKKADSHPNAIKLLLTLYYNLEKIVSTGDMSDKQKKMILLEDVKRFEALKRQISKTAYDLDSPEPDSQLEHLEEPAALERAESATEAILDDDILLNLKAIVLGIDWEITDQDLNSLRLEVVRLEELFADSKPKLILLQGIGTLGAYIKLKKSDAHADAFKLLHTIYSSLEQIVKTPMNLEEEKAILFPVVDSFNAFKTLVGSTITEKAIHRKDEPEKEGEFPATADTVVPAFADISDEETRGFQADEEARALGLAGNDNVGSHVDDFFAEDVSEGSDPADFAGSSLEESSAAAVSANLGDKSSELLPSVAKDIALQGLDVEEDEDTGLTEVGDIAPALSGVVEETDAVASLSSTDIEPTGKLDEGEAEDHAQAPPGENVDSEARPAADTIADIAGGQIDSLDKDIALQGVDVETEADDDSEEESLPTLGGELAPALAENDEISAFNTESLESLTEEAGIEEEILQNIEGLFDSIEGAPPSAALNLESETDEPIGAVSTDSKPGEVEVTSQTNVLVEEQTSEIDQQIDSFFDVDEKITQGDIGPAETTLDATEATAARPASGRALLVEDIVEEEVVFELVEEEEFVYQAPASSGADAEIVDTLESFRMSVKSLEKGFDNKLLMGVLEQLTVLRQDWAEKPLEMTFLQLLSTVIQHIDKYRHGAEADYDLLCFVCDALGQAQGVDLRSKQELLLAATTKVLDWQQGLLAQQ